MSNIKANLFIDMSNYVHRLINSMVSDIIMEKYKDYKTKTDEEKSLIKVQTAEGIDKNLIKHTLFMMIERYMKLYKTEQKNVFLCFDSSSWRDNGNESYKEGRNKDLRNIIHYWLNYMEESANQTNFNKFKIKDLEADDIIRLLCKKFNNPSEKNVVISNDKDFYQLLKLENTFIFNPFKKEEIKVSKDEAQTLFLTKVITGDVSDNIPNILPNNLMVQIPVKKRTENGMVEKIDDVDISSIQFGEKTVTKILEINNNDWKNTLKEGRIKMFKKQSKKQEYIIYSLEDLEKMLQTNFLKNKKMIDFDEIPEKNVNDFNEEFNKLKIKNFDNKHIYNFFQNEKLFKISENYLKNDLYRTNQPSY